MERQGVPLQVVEELEGVLSEIIIVKKQFALHKLVLK
jgi:hypothetical protein